MHQWKHGKKGSGVFWLQQARDEVRLNRIAQQLFDFVGKSISDESFKVKLLLDFIFTGKQLIESAVKVHNFIFMSLPWNHSLK